jgi:hypothetical protein
VFFARFCTQISQMLFYLCYKVHLFEEWSVTLSHGGSKGERRLLFGRPGRGLGLIATTINGGWTDRSDTKNKKEITAKAKSAKEREATVKTHATVPKERREGPALL